ncbi:MAG TPA: zinc ribbon domain-containing protein [Clostridiales bacterium]|jgi:hypothetical protein|nr:zinc ribbon domain-containing protein [Clostridiales bacterium]HPP68646.1 zinc ribbon domain-containing protein [Clostridiales bacterium]HQA04919.1 zinc ribbon domain-containing protein [Clostridiales bacterium]HQD71954.1 zinc ribbon domain-containing protein [Clostridiales bacterium]HXK83532.1 zinc ribbon domain-containing protein [Clostridiales bacterium]
MFFVAFFGMNDKEEHIGAFSGEGCPSCGQLSQFAVSKTYRNLEVFFLPVYKWNVRYIARALCCGAVFELDPILGKELEKNPYIKIRPENLRRIERQSPFKYCPNCRVDVPNEFAYCPYCGGKL